MRAHDAEAHLRLRTLHLLDIRSQLALVSELRCIQMVSHHLDEGHIHRTQVDDQPECPQNWEITVRVVLYDLGAVATFVIALAQLLTAARPIAARVANMLLA